MKENINNNLKQIYTFKPVINTQEMRPDEKFIEKNIPQIENYVQRRRTTLQKQKDDEEYKKKIFRTGENYTGQPTIPKEFNFRNSKQSNKSEINNTKELSLDIREMREKINANDFFEHEVYNDQNNYVNYTNNDKQNKYHENPRQNYEQVDEGQMRDALKNLHSSLLNLKLNWIFLFVYLFKTIMNY